MIEIFKLRTKVIYFKTMQKFYDNGSIFTSFLTPYKCLIRQTNNKLSQDNIINNSFSMKTRPFQQQQKKIKIGALNQK